MSTQFIHARKDLRCIEFYKNQNTGECKVIFGLSFERTGALIHLPSVKDGKPVLVLGLTPYTVEKVLNIRPNEYKSAYSIVSSFDRTTDLMIEKLLPLTICAD